MDIYLQHAAWVRNLALELVRDASAADDLVQETWLAYLKTNPDSDRPLRPWFARVLRNGAALRHRGRSNRKNRETLVADSARRDADSTETIVSRAEQQRHIAGKVLALPDPYRTILLLRFYDGLKPEAIAKDRGIPAATVRTQLRRGLQKLRDELTAEQDGNVNAWVVALLPITARPITGPSGGLLAPVATGALGVGVLAAALVWGVGGEKERNAADLFGEGSGPAQVAAPERAKVESAGADGPRQAGAPAWNERVWRLVDESNGEPLAGFSIQLAGQTLRSDGQGEVILPASTESFEVAFGSEYAIDELNDHRLRELKPMPRLKVALPKDEGVRDISVPLGPTILLRLESSGVGVISMEARFGTDGNTLVKEAGLRYQVGPVEHLGGGQARVRFADWPGGWDPAGEAQGASAWRLQVRSLDGFWSGEGSFDSLKKIPEGGLPIDFQHKAVVQGQVDMGADSQWKGGEVFLIPKGQNLRQAAYAQLDAEHRYRLPWLAPGEYELRMHKRGHEPYNAPITVLAGEELSHDIVLHPALTVGPFAGNIRSQSGEYEGKVLVILKDAKGGNLDISAPTWGPDPNNPEHGRVAHFSFDQVPVGPVVVHAVSLVDRVSIHSLERLADAPIDDADLLVLDSELRTDWLIEVCDAENAQTLSHVEFGLTPQGEILRFFRGERDAEGAKEYTWRLGAGGMAWSRNTGPTPLIGMPKDLLFDWWVKSEGYVEQTGTQADFSILESGQRSLKVFMTREP